MKCFIVFVMLVVSQLVGSQNLTVATFNIRYDNPKDAPDNWQNRFKHVAGVIKLYDFDMFGTQEGLYHQLEDLEHELGAYNYIGIGREDGRKEGEFSAIFFKKEKFKLLEQGSFWLSPIDDKPNKGWDAAHERLCTWGKFKEKQGGFEFFMFNVHFDHLGVTARHESVKMMISKIEQIAGNKPVVFVGDFNFDEHNPEYKFLKKESNLRDAFDVAEFKYVPCGTFNNFGKSPVEKGRIDHVFVSKHFKVERFGVLTNSYNGRYPSDHFPVLSVLKYQVK